MPTAGLADVAAAANFRAESIAVEIGGIYAGPHAYASGFCPTGAAPGNAMITIPHPPAELARKAKTIALSLDGPAGKIPIGPQIVCKRRNGGASPISECVFIGNVAVVQHDLDNDKLVVIGLDPRWRLWDVRVEGSFVISPKLVNATASHGDPDYYFKDGQPPIFNPGGRANGYRLPNGIKVFTPWADCSLKGDQVPGTPDDPETEDVNEAVPLEYFSLGDIIDYLWYFYGPDAAIEALLPNFPWLKKCPSDIVWPRGLASVVDDASQENFNEGRGSGNQKKGGARKGREVNLDGVSVLDSIQQMLETAGAWTLAIGAELDDREGSGKIEALTPLSIVPSRFQHSIMGATLEVASGGQAQTTLTRPMIQGGQFIENGADFINRTAGAGDRVRIERRASMDVTPVQMRVRWDESGSLGARKRMAQDPTPRGMANAFMEYESYLADYELDGDWDFQEGTDQEGRSRLPAPRAVLPRLLSWMSSINGPRDMAALQYSIRIEYKDGATWKPGPELDGLDILDDGGIRIPRLRQDMLNWHWTNGIPFEVGPDGGVLITERKIRMTLAIPCDHRTAALAAVPWKMTGSFANAEPVVCLDIARLDMELDRVGFKNLRGLYREWRRKDSWVLAESLFSGITAAEDKATADNPLVSDMAMLRAHVRHSLEMSARVRKGGVLVIPKRICMAWPPGTQISEFVHVGGALDGKRYPAWMAIASRYWSNEPGQTRTELIPA